MVHTFATFIFFVLFAKYIAWEFKKPIDVWKHRKWLIAMVATSVFAATTSFILADTLGNLILHSVGGGVVTGIGYCYLKAHFAPRFNWRVDVLALLGLVSLLGCINELYEFAFDAAGFGIYSLDRYDTWRDIAANTTGALLCWGALKVYGRFFAKKKL